MCEHKFARVLRNCRSQIQSDDIEKKSAGNSILITPPKNKEVFDGLDTIWRRWQCEGADMDIFFGIEKQLQESMQNNITQTTIAQYFT